MAGATGESCARTVFVEIKTRLNAIKSIEDCSKTINEIYSSLFSSQDHYFGNSVKSREIFLERYYGDTIEQILGLAKKSWFQKYKKTYSKDFDLLLKGGRARDIFFSFTNVLNKEKHTNVIKECIHLLEQYARSERFGELFWDQAKILPKASGGRTFYDPSVQMMWNEIIKRVISLPDRVSNIYNLPDGSILWPENFFKMIGRMIVKILKMIHAAISASTDCSLGFLSQIFAKICIRNHGDKVYSVILPDIEKLVNYSPLWCRICQKLFSSIDDSSLDAVIQPLLMNCRSHQLLYQLLGDLTKEKSHLKYLMTHKYLLYRHYNKDLIPYCIMGYLMKCSNKDCDILMETLKKLLDAWGNINGIKHTSFEHHLYITKCILIAIGFLQQNYENKRLPEQLGSALIMKLLDALPPHLESPIDKFRNLGMIVAEEITKISQVKGIEPLKFEFHRDDETIYLSSIAGDPTLIERTEEKQSLPDIESVRIEDTGKCPDPNNLKSVKTYKESADESDLDSDDDLEPYPMDDEDEESVVNGVRPPVYISECISGLLSKDDPSRLEACLAVAEKLARREPPELPELAIEFIKVLLYLQDNYDTKNFLHSRHGAMVATTVKCPKKVISYLTKEFYEENYNLRQRMDILEVISSSAQELSQPIDIDPMSIHKHLPLPNIPGIISREKPEWQVIVEDRIKKKTRIISHGRKNPSPNVVANKFSTVAGDFFFPLLKNFDSKCRTLDLLGQDFLVLGKLIHCLGTIIHASSGLSITRMMTSAMFDFVWSLRYHKESFVRQALLYATCMCLLACPSSILVSDLNSELMENHQWVTDVATSDPNETCRQLAIQTHLLLETVLKRTFNQSDS